jgi:alginate O-acetyltransferase complex protein AlgI
VVFSSNLFLFGFLPVVLTVHFLLPARLRNLFLFAASIFFYTWGSGPIVIPFVAAIAFNYWAGAFIARAAKSAPRRAKLLLGLTLGADCALLFYYKYFNFFCGELGRALQLLGVDWQQNSRVTLPIGISFFLFQAMTYPVEIYRGEEKPAKRLVDVAAYLALFAHLIAGPVVRYSEIRRELETRSVTIGSLFYGLQRFAVGLGKKVLIANQLGVVADGAFGAAPGTLTAAMAWLGTVCYSLQIYFDFSGYSDMAIGLAEFLGFHFPENFNDPYRATSITDFWRRWHMTLSRWFRDFVYIPLGGNQKGELRTYLNLFVVFFLCGLWHGAAWNFVVWGMFHGALLVAERVLKTRFGFVPSGPIGTVVTCSLVFIGWVLFRAADTTAALGYLRTMFGFSPSVVGFQYYPPAYYLTRTVTFTLTGAMALTWLPRERLRELRVWTEPIGITLVGAASLALIFCSAAVLSTVAFNPFIYFRF